MAYSNTHSDFYQTAMGTMVTEPQSAWDTSTHCADCGVQYIYCGCPNDEVEPFSQERSCNTCGDIVPMLFLLGGDRTERCLYCHNSRAVLTRNEDAEWDEWVLGIED